MQLGENRQMIQKKSTFYHQYYQNAFSFSALFSTVHSNYKLFSTRHLQKPVIQRRIKMQCDLTFSLFLSGCSELADLPGERGADPRSYELQPAHGAHPARSGGASPAMRSKSYRCWRVRSRASRCPLRSIERVTCMSSL
jgi:hypothetical protein